MHRCREKARFANRINSAQKRANAFYEHLRQENDGEITFSFDCQTNQPVPKIPDQAAYYSRQMYLYNFTICQGASTDNQGKDKTVAYVWLENKYPKGSNQVASAVYHRLISTDLSSYHTL